MTILWLILGIALLIVALYTHYNPMWMEPQAQKHSQSTSKEPAHTHDVPLGWHIADTKRIDDTEVVVYIKKAWIVKEVVAGLRAGYRRYTVWVYASFGDAYFQFTCYTDASDELFEHMGHEFADSAMRRQLSIEVRKKLCNSDFACMKPYEQFITDAITHHA